MSALISAPQPLHVAAFFSSNLPLPPILICVYLRSSVSKKSLRSLRLRGEPIPNLCNLCNLRILLLSLLLEGRLLSSVEDEYL